MGAGKAFGRPQALHGAVLLVDHQKEGAVLFGYGPAGDGAAEALGGATTWQWCGGSSYTGMAWVLASMKAWFATGQAKAAKNEVSAQVS